MVVCALLPFNKVTRKEIMKFTKLILLSLLLTSVCIMPAFAQQTTETVTIPVSQLTEAQKTELAKKELQEKADKYGKWVGIGHELGTAVNESLSSVTSNANAFSQTGVGKITIALVVYKVVGKELIGVMLGLLFFFVGVPIWVWAFYRNCITHRICISKTKEKSEWQVVNDPASYDMKPYQINPITMQRLLHAVALAVLTIIVCALAS